MIFYNPSLSTTKSKSAFPKWMEVASGAFKSRDALSIAEFNELGWFELQKQGPSKDHLADGWEIVRVGDIYINRPIIEVEDPAAFQREFDTKQAEIRDGAEAFLAQYKSEYGATEIATWDQQYDEAVKFLADPQVDTPLLSAIATPRGMTVEELATRVVSNHAAWVAISGAIVGQRLTFQDQLDDATSLEDIYNITVNYSL